MLTGITRSERLAGGIWGLLVGDALGVPYEFAPPQRIPALHKIDMEPPVEFLRSHWGIAPGTWSDDGAQALCVLSSLLEKGAVDPHDMLDKFCRWFRDGYLAVDRNVFDVGLQTRQSIGKFLSGRNVFECASDGEWSNGNGSLMRMLPLGLWHRGTDEALCRDAMLQSRTTHGHLRSALCCALHGLWTRRLLAESPTAWEDALGLFEAIFPPGTVERAEYDASIHPREPDPCKGSGYVVDSLLSAVQCMQAGGYEAVVKACVAMGNDTDTTACIAGGAAGVRDGVRAIPPKWRTKLRGKEIATPLLDAFLAYERSFAPPPAPIEAPRLPTNETEHKDLAA